MIAGLQKMTLLDYPGKVACTVFMQGCNYRCPFCHNSDLLSHGGEPLMTTEAFLQFLQKRRGLLDGVCVSGGEPTLSTELEDLLRGIKVLGFSVKLDTNGTNPKLLKHLAGQGLVDHVAMDVKNGPAGYARTVGLEHVALAPLEESLAFLIGGGVSYELRTTLVQQLHDDVSILDMGRWLSGIVPGKKPAMLYLQSFVDRSSVVFEGLSAPDPAQTAHFSELLGPFVEQVAIRGQ